MKQQEEEILDIVDQDDQVITSMPRSQIYAKNLCAQMRSVWLFIKNQKGELWIPRRAVDRKILPGYLDGSVVGHVKSGESYEQGVIRETAEEAGLNLLTLPYQFVGKVTPQEDHAFCFVSVFECVVDRNPVNWNRDEFSEWFWLTPEQLIEQFEAGVEMKDTLPIILRKYYLLD